MAVPGQKRKAMGDPCALRLETSGSNAGTAFAEMQAYQKRRRSVQVISSFTMLSCTAKPWAEATFDTTRRTPKFVRQGGP